MVEGKELNVGGIAFNKIFIFAFPLQIKGKQPHEQLLRARIRQSNSLVILFPKPSVKPIVYEAEQLKVADKNCFHQLLFNMLFELREVKLGSL